MANEKSPNNATRPDTARSTTTLRVLVAVVCVACLYFAHAAFVPIALSLLFALLLSSPVETLHRKGLPRSVSAILILLIFLGISAGAVNALWEPAQQWLANAPRTVRTIEQKMGPIARVLHRIDIVTDRAGHLTDGGAGPAPAAQKPAAPAEPSGGLLVETRTMIVAFMTIVILTLFLLAGGPPVLARMTTAFASDVHATKVLQVIDAVRSEVGRYYATIALINLGLGIATGLVMMALGMPNPILWGALAGALNFIPYVGSATTLIVVTIVAFVSFDGVGHVLAVAASYLALATLEGQVVQPLLVGQRLELNPIIVFLALWFGGWLWGIAGIVLAVPTLVALKVVAEHSERGAPVVEFLSPSLTKRFKPLSAATKEPRKADRTADVAREGA
jgi:predicted PurR-regulated permease PerM